MLVRHTSNPSIILYIEGKAFQFEDYLCDLPKELAIHVTSGSNKYELVENTQSFKFDPSTWQPDHKELICSIPVGFNNGYGRAAMDMALGLIRENVDVKVVNKLWHGHSREHIPEELLERMNPKKISNSFAIMMHLATTFNESSFDRLVGYTMLEATLIPQTWVDAINNKCERLIVPCEQNRQAFKDSGVKCDIEVVHLGIDTDLFPYKKRKFKDDGFVFGIMGTLTYRKGADILVSAFHKAFPRKEYPNVNLYIKTQKTPQGQIAMAPFLGHLKDDRILVNTNVMTPKQLLNDFFYAIDCFVFPSRGEGYGLPPVEAMSTGLPVIATNWSGLAENMLPNHSYPLEFEMETMGKNGTEPADAEFIRKYGRVKEFRYYPEDLYREGQQWAAPSEDHLIELMRHVYNNRDQAIKKGKIASGYIKRHKDIHAQAKKIIKYLDKKF